MQLYSSAPSFDEYKDADTVVQRLSIMMISLINQIDVFVRHGLLQTFEDTGLMGESKDEFNLDDGTERKSVDYPGGTLRAVHHSILWRPEADGTQKGYQVSSQGCSRVFIIKVLLRVSDYVRGKHLPSIFTFRRELVMGWLNSAKEACCGPDYPGEERYYGGPQFVYDDTSTHWSEPHQLYTWWKNNVERRTKYRVIQEDAIYSGFDPRRISRARWCEAVVSLSEVIRASSGSSVAARAGVSVGPVKERKTSSKKAYGAGGAKVRFGRPKKYDTKRYNEDDVDYDETAPMDPDDGAHEDNGDTEGDALQDSYDRGGTIPMSGKGSYSPFPVKLFDLLQIADEEVVKWSENGRVFLICDMDRFTDEVLPKHFKHNNFTSFQRQLNFYGFRRSTMLEKGAYFHPKFCKGRRELAFRIKRNLNMSVESDGVARSTAEIDADDAPQDLQDHMAYSPGKRELSASVNPHRSKRKYTRRKTKDEIAAQEAAIEEMIDDAEDAAYPLIKLQKRGRPSKKTAANGVEGDDDDEGELQQHAKRAKSSKKAVFAGKRYDDEVYDFTYGPSYGSSRRSAGDDCYHEESGRARERLPHKPKRKALLQRYYNRFDVPMSPDEDMLDLTLPKKKRVYIDFTSDQGTDDAVMAAGPFHGIFISGLEDGAVAARYCRLQNAASESSGNVQAAAKGRSRMVTAQSRGDNGPKSSRVGEEFQAVVPAVDAKMRGQGEGVIKGLVSERMWSAEDPNDGTSEAKTDRYLERVGKIRAKDLLPVGSVVVLHFEDSVEVSDRYRLSLILEYNSAEGIVRVFDGENYEYLMERTLLVAGVRHLDGALGALHSSERIQAPLSDAAVRRSLTHLNSAHENKTHMWTADEAHAVSDGVRRYGDNLRKVWLLVEDTKTYQEVLDFFQLIYHPYSQRMGVRRLMDMFRRADRARNGETFSDNEEEEEEDEGSSIANSSPRHDGDAVPSPVKSERKDSPEAPRQGRGRPRKVVA